MESSGVCTKYLSYFAILLTVLGLKTNNAIPPYSAATPPSPLALGRQNLCLGNPVTISRTFLYFDVWEVASCLQNNSDIKSVESLRKCSSYFANWKGGISIIKWMVIFPSSSPLEIYAQSLAMNVFVPLGLVIAIALNSDLHDSIASSRHILVSSRAC